MRGSESPAEIIVAAGRTAGILASTPAELADYARLGARYLIFNGESLVQWGARRAFEALDEKAPA